MIKWFVGNRPIVLILLPVVIFLLVVVNLLFNYYPYTNLSNFGMWGSEIQLPTELSLVLGPLVVLFNSGMLSRLFNTNGLLDRNTYITSLLYVVYFSFYHSFYRLDGLVLAHTFLIGTLFQLFRLQQNVDGRKNIFNAGFMAGMAITFHPASVLFFPFIYFSVVVIRPFFVRELILLIVGVLVPILYASIYLWYMSGNIDLQVLNYSSEYGKIQIDFLVTAALFLASIFFSFLALNKQSQKTGIRTKKMIRMLVWISISAVLLGLYDYLFFKQIERFSLLLIPMVVFLTFGFTDKAYFPFAKALFFLVVIYSVLKLFL